MAPFPQSSLHQSVSKIGATDVSTSSGRQMGSSRKSFNISRSSLLDDSEELVKMTSLLRTPLTDVSTALSTTASYHGSGISDVRTAIAAQQRQLNTLVDKIASLLAAMHAEVLQDVQVACQKGASTADGRFNELSSTISEMTKHILDLTEREKSLRASFDQTVSLFTDRLAHEIQHTKAHVSDELGRLHEGILNEVQGVDERMTSEYADLQTRIAELEVDIQGTDQACTNLRDSFCQHVMEVSEPLAERLSALEDRLQLPGQLRAAHKDRSRAPDLTRIEHIEHGLCQQGDALEQIKADIHNLRRANVDADDLEDRLEVISADVTNRLGQLEQWVHHADDIGFQNSRWQSFCDRIASTEHRCDCLHDRMEVLADYFDCASNSARGVPSPDQRFQHMSEQLDSLASALHQESRLVNHRLAEIRTFSARMDASDDRLEALQQQMLDLRATQRASSQVDNAGSADSQALAIQDVAHQVANLRQDLETRVSQVEIDSQQMVEGLKQDVATQIKKTRSASQQLAEELQKGIDAQGMRAQEMARKTYGTLRKELDAQAEQTSQQIDLVRHDSEARVAQLHNSSLQLVDELKKELESRSEQATGSSHLFVQEFKKELEACNAQVKACSTRCLDEMHRLRQDLETQVVHANQQSQRAASELRHEILLQTNSVKDGCFEAMVKQANQTAQQLTNNLRRDIELQIDDVQSSLQRFSEDLNSGLQDMHLVRADLDHEKEATEASRGQILGILAATQGKLEDLSLARPMAFEPNALTVPPDTTAADTVVGACQTSSADNDHIARPTSSRRGRSPPGSQEGLGAQIAGDTVGQSLQNLSHQLSCQEGELVNLRDSHLQLRGELQGYLLEQKIGRSLAGLEPRSRSLSNNTLHGTKSVRRASSLCL